MKTRVLFAMAALAALAAKPNYAFAQAATICKDGTTSDVSGRGACSSHGGVDKKATSAASKTAKAKEVTCGDGTMSKPGRGACGHHGGIKGNGAATETAPVTPSATPAMKRSTPAASTAAATPATSGASNATGGSGKREDNDPTGAIAKCKDGMFSHSKHRQGACSRHGGVAQWITK